MSHNGYKDRHATSRRHGQPRGVPRILQSLHNETRRSNIIASPAQEFDPHDWRYPSDWSPEEIVTEPLGSGFSSLSCPRYPRCPKCHKHVPHIDSLVVAVDGACRGNGRKDGFVVKAGVGVYFRDASDLNISARLDALAGQELTNQQAELQAALVALSQINDFKENRVKYPNLVDEDGPELKNLSDIIIKTDSKYVVRGMTEWMGKWTRNGFRTYNGNLVVNASLFQLLGQTVTLIQDKLKCKVYLWHVPRQFNAQANSLAQQAVA
jgi:ribonuclease HI